MSDSEIADWKGGMAVGFIILCIMLGIGGCGYLWSIGEARKIEAERNTITITNSFNHIEEKP